MLFVFESSDSEKRLPRRRRRSEGGAHHHLEHRDPCRAWHPGGRMGSSAAPFPRQKDVIPAASGDRMTATPFQPLPVGGVPAWLLGPFCRTSPPFLHLPPSRLQFGADLTRQGSPRPPQFSVALQLWLVATHASPRTPITTAMMATEACATAGPSPFLRLPIGGQKGIPLLTVSAPNRSKRDNCCSARRRLKIGRPVAYSKTQCYNSR